MKRFGNLFDKICNIENLREADRKARKGKEKTYGVKIFDKNKELYLLLLLNDLRTGKYHTSKYSTFVIYEPKERIIYRLPYYPDRIVHHAIMNIMEPIWISVFVKNTYSCIKNRGIHKALNDLKYDLSHNPYDTKYCLKLDIKKFYPSINHKILKQIVRKKIKDVRLLELLDEIIDSANGVPIGNYLSLFFANLYLTYFDHWIKEIKHVKYYYRYADDIVILNSNKKSLHVLFNEIQKYLQLNLDLLIKYNYLIFPVEKRGIDFIGYVFRHNYTKIRKIIKKHICTKAIRDSKTLFTTKERRLSIGSYIGWMKYCNSKQLKIKINSYYNESIL